MAEEWKVVEGHPNYHVSNLGNVKNITTNRILVQARRMDKGSLKGMVVTLDKKAVCIHRLVAETFIPNPDKLPFVTYINGDRTNNRVENLKWISVREKIDKNPTLMSNTGEIYITFSAERNNFCFKYKDKIYKRYATLEQAVVARDEYLRNNNLL